MQAIKQTWENPITGMSGVYNIYKKAKAIDKSVAIKLAKSFLDKQYSSQIHKQIRKPKFYFPITSSEENELVQIDLADMKNISRVNKNYKWLFVCVDVFTRKAYVFPMKFKNTKNILIAFNKLLSKIKPEIIMADNGTEFTSRKFVQLCKDNNIKIDYVNINNHLIPHTGNRLGIVDRFIQTLRHKLDLYFDQHNRNKYIDVLDQIVENINNTVNSGIKSIPNKPDDLMIEQIMTQKILDAIPTETKFEIGDKVRCVTNKHLFEKGVLIKWGNKVYIFMNSKAIY